MREHAAQLEHVEILELPMRRMYVKNGPIGDAAEPFGIPGRTTDLCWPTDRQWFVATDIDLMTTYVGRDAHCINAIISDELGSDAIDQRTTDNLGYRHDQPSSCACALGGFQ